jgi:uncharacterized protein (TIGR02300 family)
MGRAELGTKCACTGCSERFYDLNRTPAVCPKCGVEQAPQKPRAAWPVRGTPGPRRAYRPPAPIAADEDSAVITAAEDEDEEDDDAVADTEDDDTDSVIDADHDVTPD